MYTTILQSLTYNPLLKVNIKYIPLQHLHQTYAYVYTPLHVHYIALHDSSIPLQIKGANWLHLCSVQNQQWWE